MKPPVRVLAVDDSAVMRAMYRELLVAPAGMELIATAPNADIARRKILALDPDVVVLDIEMPGEDGLTFLQWLMTNFPTPVVVCSSFSPRGAEQTMRAFSLGAIDVVCKTTVATADEGRDFTAALLAAVRAAAAARPRMRRSGATPRVTVAAPTPTPVQPFVPPTATRPRAASGSTALRRGTVIVIGASTGGTEALAGMITQMPANFPPTLVVQHMPPLYTAAFARRLDTLGDVRVEEARDGCMIGPGRVLIAPGGKQLSVLQGASGPIARVRDDPPVNRHAPSVDVLFDSAAEHYRLRLIGVLLTGMGNDGAAGLLTIRQAGGFTIAQDEASSVVWGMPQEAIKLGAADQVLPVSRITPRILQWLSEPG